LVPNDHRYKSARDALKFEILLILFAVRFKTFWHRHRIMTHFWQPALCVYDGITVNDFGFISFFVCVHVHSVKLSPI